MAPSRMVPAVLAATAIHMVHLHLSHYLTGGQGLLDGLWEDKTFATFWETQIQAIDAKSPANNNTLTLPDGTANGTAVAAEPHPAAAAAALFSAAWLVELLGTFAAGIAVYYWSVGVERAFPARPRGVAVVAGKEKTGLLSEDREEEVVKQVSVLSFSRLCDSFVFPRNHAPAGTPAGGKRGTEKRGTDLECRSGSPRAACVAHPSAGATLSPNGCSP